MKRIVVLLVVLVACTLCSPAIFAQDWSSKHELAVSGSWFIPSDSDVFERQRGAELELRQWMNSNVGLAFGVGLGRWEVDQVQFRETKTVPAIDLSTSGDVTTIPFGPSILFCTDVDKPLRFVLEAGVRYVEVDSSVRVSPSEQAGAVSGKRVNLDEAWLGVLNAQLEGGLNEYIGWLLGLGYQVDLKESDVEVQGYDVSEISFEALALRGGFIVRF